MTLAQLKAQTEAESAQDRGVGGAFMDAGKKIFNRLFGPDERPPAPPTQEIGANEMNLVSANKRQSGGDGNSMMHHPGSDPWLATLPNMGPYRNALFAETESEITNQNETENTAADIQNDSAAIDDHDSEM